MRYSGLHGDRRGGAQEFADAGEDIFVRFDRRVIRRLFGFVRPHRLAFAGALAAVGAHTLAQVSIPVMVRHAIDAAVGQSSLPLDLVLAGFAALIVVNAGLHFLGEWLSARLAQRVIFELRRAMFAHLQKVSLSVLERTQVGHLMARLQGDTNALQEFFENSVSAVGDCFLLVGIIVVLVGMDPRLGSLTLAVLPVLVVVRALWIPWAKARFRAARDASSRVNAALAENINGIRTVQETHREAFNFAHYTETAEANRQAQIASSLASQCMVPLVDLLTGVAMAVVAVVGGAYVLDGSMGVGVMVAYLFFVQRFFEPIRTLSMQYTVMQRAMAAAHRIFELLDLPVNLRESASPVDLSDVPPAVRFDRVVFGYRPGRPVLHGIDLSIEACRTVALVGPTGSGKTSIAALLRRFYDVWEGSVQIGGVDVRDAGFESMGRTVGMVLQEPFLFTGSIAENIAYGVHGVTRERVIAAARLVCADSFIELLPDGYDTALGQNGCNLSIGQKQLLSFARTLLIDPKILILDEATANIDSFTEAAIQRALQLLRRGRTTLIIAHRLATVRDADCIVVLNAGRIVEKGTHAELLAAGGLYARLHAGSLHVDPAESALATA